jgi:hypothetical protein
MAKVNAVNVIEYSHETDSVSNVHTFVDEAEAMNKEAEKFYTSKIKELNPEVTEEELTVFLDDGWFEQGEIAIFITHSFSDE